MGLKRSLLSGIVAFVVATAAVRATGKKELGTRIGLLTAGAVVLSTLFSGGDRGADVEFEDELVTE